MNIGGFVDRPIGHWIVRLKNNETMNFDWRCHYVDCGARNVAIFTAWNEEFKDCKEPLAMIPYHMIEYIKFIKED